MAPFGHPFLGKLAVRFRLGEKVISGVAKETVSGAFWSPFGRLFDDISEYTGRNKTIPFSWLCLRYSQGMFCFFHHVFSGYSLSFHHVFFRYSLGCPSIFSSYSLSVLAVLLRVFLKYFSKFLVYSLVIPLVFPLVEYFVVSL